MGQLLGMISEKDHIIYSEVVLSLRMAQVSGQLSRRWPSLEGRKQIGLQLVRWIPVKKATGQARIPYLYAPCKPQIILLSPWDIPILACLALFSIIFPLYSTFLLVIPILLRVNFTNSFVKPLEHNLIVTLKNSHFSNTQKSSLIWIPNLCALTHHIQFSNTNNILVGGFNPSEKYESQIGSSSQLLGKIKVMFQTTNQCFLVYKP